MSKYKIEIESKPFSWYDKMAQLAVEDFDSIRNNLTYCQCQSIGLALAKLKMIENGDIDIPNDNKKLKQSFEELDKCMKKAEESWKEFDDEQAFGAMMAYQRAIKIVKEAINSE